MSGVLRGFLKHAGCKEPTSSTTPLVTADDNISITRWPQSLGIAIPKTVLLAPEGISEQRGYHGGILHILKYPNDWDGLLDYVGRPAI